MGLTKEAIRRSKTDRKIYVAGDISMTGQQLEPIGSMPFEELVDVYKQQVRLLAKEGVDLFAIETMMSLQECRRCLAGGKRTCDIPALVTLTYRRMDGRYMERALRQHWLFCSRWGQMPSELTVRQDRIRW